MYKIISIILQFEYFLIKIQLENLRLNPILIPRFWNGFYNSVSDGQKGVPYHFNTGVSNIRQALRPNHSWAVNRYFYWDFLLRYPYGFFV